MRFKEHWNSIQIQHLKQKVIFKIRQKFGVDFNDAKNFSKF